MSETVDTRVVEARFDSAQFEKGVDKTVKKLDELKSSLNLKDSGKTVTEVTSKIQEGTENASKSLEKLQNRFTSFTGMLKQKFISGIADEIVGVFFRIKSSFENMVTSLSTAQIGVGMQRYNDILTSVRTLVSAGVDQGKAYEAIERLGEYADQTSYSLDSMVSTMSKFKTAGADIDTAARMIEGLSNAAASMGVNAQQAERAYLNLQQAYSKGAMMQNDWISFESLPMVGTKFNQAIIDAAVAVGTLEASKPDKNGNVTYKTKKKAGSQVKTSGADSKGITAENMGTKLSSRWFNKEVMEQVFGDTYYFAEVGIDEVNKIKKIERELKSKYGDNKEGFTEAFQKELDKLTDQKRLDKIEELKDQFVEGSEEFNKALAEFDKHNHLTTFAYDAFRAGQEARSFTDVLNTLKDAISRGWAKSFELIFGKLDEAADFFTKLTESNLANAIYRIGEFRNLVLEGWKNQGGRNSLLSALSTMDNTLGLILKKVGLLEYEYEDFFDQDEYNKLLEQDPSGYAAKLYEDQAKAQYKASNGFESAAERLSDRLLLISGRINYYAQAVQNWLNEVDPKTKKSRIDRIIETFTEVKTILHEVIEIASTIITRITGLVAKLEGPLTKLWAALGKVLTPIKELLNPESENGIAIYNAIDDVFGNIGKVVDMLVGEDGKSGPLSILIDVLGEVAKFFVELATGTFVTNLTFISDALGFFMELIFGTSNQKENNRGVIEGISNDIKSLGEACKDALQFVSDFFTSLLDSLRRLLGFSTRGLGVDISEFFKSIFYEKTTVANTGKVVWVKKEFTKKLEQVFNTAVTTVKKWFTYLPGKVVNLGISIGDFFHGLFYQKVTRYNGSMLETKEIETPLKQWFDNAITTVKDFIQSIPEKISKVTSIVGEFFHGLFYQKKLSHVYYDATGRHETYTEIETPLKQWLDNAIATVKDFIKSIPEKIAKGVSIIGEFFHGLFYQKKLSHVYYDATGRHETYTEIETPLKQWLNQAIENVKTFIKSIPTKLAKIPSLISEFFNNLFYTKVTITKGIKKNGRTATNTITVRTSLKIWLDNAIESVKTFIKSIPEKIAKIPSLIGEFFHGLFYHKVTRYNGSMLETKEVETPFKEFIDGIVKSISDFISGINLSDILTGIKDFGRTIINGFVTIFTGESDWSVNKEWLSNKIAGAIESIRAKAEEVWPKVSGWFIDLPNKIANFFKDEDGTKNEGTPIGSAFSNFIGTIGLWLSSIPGTLLKTWENVEKEIGGLWDTIIGAFTGEGQHKKKFIKPNDVIGQMIEDDKNAGYNDTIYTNLNRFFSDLLEYLKKKIMAIPGDIVKIWESAKTIGGIIWDILTGQTSKDDPKDYGSDLYNNIARFFESVAGWIQEGINSLSTTVKGWFAPQSWFDQKEYDKILKKNGTNAAALYESQMLKKDTYNPRDVPIVEFFKGIISTIGSLFENMGPTIVSGIETALKWIGEKLGDATEFFKGLISSGDSIEDALKADGKEHPLWEAVKSLGQTIWDILTKTIPEFIGSAASYIGSQLPTLFSKIFGGEEEQTEVGEQIAGAILGKKDKLDKELLGFDKREYDRLILEQGQDAADAYKESCKNALSKVDKAKKDIEKSTSGSIDVFGWLLTLGSTAHADELDNADDVSNASDNATKTVESMGGFLGSLTKTFNSIASNKLLQIGVIIGLVAFAIHELTDLVDNIMFLDDAVGWNAKWVGIGALMTAMAAIIGWCVYLASTGDSDTLSSVYGVLEEVTSIIERIGQVITTIMGMAAGKSLFSMLESFFDWREAKNLRKMNLQTSGQMAKTGLLTGFLNRMLTYLGIAEGVDIITAGIEKGIENITLAIDSIASITGSIVKIVTDLTSVADEVGPAIDSITSIGQLFQAIREIFTIKELSADYVPGEHGGAAIVNGEELQGIYYWIGDVEYFASEALETAEKVSDITPIGKKAEYVTKNTMDEFIRMSRMLTRLSGAISEFKTALKIDADSTTITADIQALIGMTDQMAAFGEFGEKDEFKKFNTALASLGAALSLYSLGEIKPENFDSSVIESAISLLSQLFGNDELQSLVGTLTKNELPEQNELMEKSQRMVIFAGALASLAKACKELDDDSGENIKKLFETVSTIPTSEYNGKKIDELSVQFGELGNAIGTFAFNTADLSTTNIDNAQTALDMLLRLAIGLKDIPNDTVLANIFTGNKGLDKFGLDIESLSRHLKTFFENLENIQNGDSVSYNRSNLQMALLAVQGIAEGVNILANAKYIDAFNKTWGGNLGQYLTGLGELGQQIMNFVTTVNGYTDVKTYGVINYDFVFNAIDALEKVVTAIQKVPQHYTGTGEAIGQRIITLGKILFGDAEYDSQGNITKAATNSGVLGHLNRFLAFVVSMTHNGEYEIQLSDAAAMISGYASLVGQVVTLLIDLDNIQYGDLIAENHRTGIAASYETSLNPFDILLPSFTSMNDNFDTYKKFLENASEFNKLGLDNALIFFSGLESIANALYTFSLKNESTGRYRVNEGLERLFEFNWIELQDAVENITEIKPKIDLTELDESLQELWKMLGLIESEDKSSSSMKLSITPVLDLTNFESQASQMRNMIGLEAFNPETGDINNELKLQLNIEDLKTIIPQKDFLTTEFGLIKQEIASVTEATNSLSASFEKLGFYIDGETLVRKVGPAIDKYLGTQGILEVRLNYKN